MVFYDLALNLGHTKNGLGQREQQKALKKPNSKKIATLKIEFMTCQMYCRCLKLSSAALRIEIMVNSDRC